MRPTEQLIAACQNHSVSALQAQRGLDLNFILGSTLLVKMDMATMAASIEARSPLLDHVVAEFTAALPQRFLLRHGRTKAVLRDAYRAEIPADVIDGRKRGFEIPLVSWLKNELRPVLMDTVGNRDAAVRDYLDGDFVNDLLAGRTLPERNWGYLVYALLVLELWLRGE
jgi:asparagine synthase (glutamine-hydrolysing)